jgi:hypothetical protein
VGEDALEWAHAYVRRNHDWRRKKWRLPPIERFPHRVSAEAVRAYRIKQDETFVPSPEGGFYLWLYPRSIARLEARPLDDLGNVANILLDDQRYIRNIIICSFGGESQPGTGSPPPATRMWAAI